MNVHYWEVVYDKLHQTGWSLGWVSYVNTDREVIWVTDAHRGAEEHLATEGKSIAEAVLRLYFLTESNNN